MEMIIMELQPFPLCAKKHIVKYFKFDPSSIYTFKKYMKKPTHRVEMKNAKELHPKCAFAFYGWSIGNDHFLGVFATLPNVITTGYDDEFLAFSPLEDGYRLN